jgi:dephospho-CoA kinase
MIKAGITGGIGSGKSIVCRVFEVLGVSVYYSDTEAKKLYVTDMALREKMISLFGKNIYKKGGIDRQKLAGIIFSDAKMLKAVNHIVHSAVKEDFLKWSAIHSNGRYVIFESAVLAESRHIGLMDAVVAVTAPEQVRIDRVLERPGMTRKAVEAIIRNQMSDEERISLSDYVIINDDTHLILPQILKLHLIFNSLKDQSGEKNR